MNNKEQVIHDVRVTTVIKIILVILAFALLYLIRDIVIIFFVALILAALTAPAAEYLKRYHIPRSLTVLGIYILIIAVLIFVISAIVPPILEELRALVVNFSHFWERIISGSSQLSVYVQERGFIESFQRSLDSVTAEIPRVVLGTFSSISGVARSLFSLALIFVLSFYLVVEEEQVKQFIRSLMPEKYRPYTGDVITRVQKKIGIWMRSQLLVSAAVFLLTYIGLLILGMPYALVLALIAGLLEFIPYIGPFIAGVPAVILGLSISPLHGLLVLILYIVVQQLENNVLVPKISQKVIGLNPIISILALLLGARLAGFLGILIAIPIATSLKVILDDFLAQRERLKNSNV